MGRLATFSAGMALVAVLFLPVFQNGFVFDDDALIERGDVIHDPSRALDLFVHPAMHAVPDQRDKTRAVDTYRPLSMLTFFWDAQLSGRAPWSYHLTNLLAHLAALLVFYRLARRLLARSPGWALLATAWFTLSPLPQAAHIWINGRSDVLCVIFGGASILLWLRALDAPTAPVRKTALLLASGLMFLAALLCKEIWVGTLPALFFWPQRSETDTPKSLLGRYLAQPELAARAMADCLRNQPGQPACEHAYRDLITAHPRASEYRELFSKILSEPASASLRKSLPAPGN